SSDWGLSFTYDGFGNKTHQSVTKGSGPVHSYSIDVATNRITNPGFQYDANGNVTAGLLGLTGTYTYDVENRMVDNGAEKYGYGAGNRRLWKMLAGQGPVADVYFYGLGGEVLEVFRGSPGSPLERQTYAPTQRAWFGGRLIEKKGTAMNADRLGTYEKSFPYGELATAPTTSGEKFATYWRDAGTGLDYAVNRYYSPQMGRFLSADPYQASGGPGDPGSWNRYAYVGGDPVNYSDPGGLQKWSCDVNEPDFRECAAKQAGTQEFLSAGGGRAIGGAIFIPGFTAYWFATFFEGMPGASGGAPTKVPRRTYFLTVTKDCYEVPEQGAVTRNITYQLMFQEKGMPRAMGYPFAVIWEHLTGSLPKSGPDSPSSGPRGWFPDQQSVVNMTGITFMEGTQRFSAKWDNGREVGLPVYGFGGNPVELDIKRYMGYVSINGNIGGQVDPLTGRLIPGTYKPCD
ncbi:MAG TPA: RHS repeat-associated core domain-containing protein, partial [Paludibaculum sp.]